MAVNKRPTFTNFPGLALGKITPDDTTDRVPLLVAGASGYKVTALFAAGEDTADRTVVVSIKRGSDFFPLVAVLVPDGSGATVADPVVDLFTAALRDILPKDGDGQPYLFLMLDDEIQINVLSAVTGSEQVSVFAVYGDFDDGVA